jgi:phosphohistidine phosphatase
MQIYLLRHGIAEDRKPGMSDADRALTAEGVQKLREVLKRLHASGVQPALILSSPYKRALQTAEIAAAQFGYKEDILRTTALQPDSDPEDAWEEIRVHKGEPSILLVGHEPLFSMLSAFLLDSRSLRVDFKKGAILRIDVEIAGALPRGLLKWMLIPKLA